MSCKMGGRTRQWFCILAGVLQGGILSPSFYSLYVDDLIVKLEKLNVGCYIMDVLMAALLSGGQYGHFGAILIIVVNIARIGTFVSMRKI